MTPDQITVLRIQAELTCDKNLTAAVKEIKRLRAALTEIVWLTDSGLSAARCNAAKLLAQKTLNAC